MWLRARQEVTETVAMAGGTAIHSALEAEVKQAVEVEVCIPAAQILY